MLQELSHMDRITQLQDEIQQVCHFLCFQLGFHHSDTAPHYPIKLDSLSHLPLNFPPSFSEYSHHEAEE